VRVLLVSKFLHHVGGVETYLRWQATELSKAGYEVAVFGMEPPAGEQAMAFPDLPIFMSPERSFDPDSPLRVRSAAASVYSPAVGRRLSHAIRTFRPDIIHFHGTCYQLTPAVFREAQRSNARIFLTAHEYKLVCANQILYDDRRQEVCTDCVGRSSVGKSIRILRRRCIKGAVGPSVLGAVETPIAASLWRKCDGRVLAPSRFMADILRKDGRCGYVEHLELPWPEPDIKVANRRTSILFMARLNREKGIRIAVEAWARVAQQLPHVRMRIAGQGPESDWIREHVAATGLERIDLLGLLDRPAIDAELAGALLTIHPSTCHDNSPFSVRESLCAGVPAAVTDLGGAGELVGGDRGPVLSPLDLDGWAAAMLEAAQTQLAGSDRFMKALTARWYGAQAHLERLETLYAA
jgi:glycosyltransferase involved in cell wall biosynthesis